MYVQRNLEKIIEKYMDCPEIIAITGPRQAGKTTMLRHIQSRLKKSVFIDFEDIEVRQIFDEDIRAFTEIYVKPYNYIFIDEFQYSHAGGQALKYIYDTEKDKKIIITGSSAIDLTIKAVKYLAGRIFYFELFSFSFDEFLRYKDKNLYEFYRKLSLRNELSGAVIEKINSYLEEFIIYGGYPRVVLAADKDEKRQVLKSLYSVYLLKDIKDIIHLADDYKMMGLINALALQIGQIISYDELATIAKLNFQTLKKYLNLLEKSFVISLVRPFFTNKRIELVKNPKVFFTDTGLRNAVIGDFNDLSRRPDSGNLYENFVFSELLKSGAQIKFWRTKSKAEVDFIVDENIPVEVKSAISKLLPGRAMINFIKKYKPSKAYLLSRNLMGKIRIEDTMLHFLPHFYVGLIDRDR